VENKSEMADLIVRVKQGDPDAYEAVVGRYRLAALSREAESEGISIIESINEKLE
jgi:hypothetical protein